MLVLLSNLNLVTRIEIPVSEAVQNTLLQGSWIKWDGTKSDNNNEGNVQVWTEANRSAEKALDATFSNIATVNTPRFSPDAGDTTQLTVIYGKYRALTNLCASASGVSQGQFLTISAAGVLAGMTPASGTSQDAVAVCTKAAHKYTHIGQEYDVIEYVTL